MDERNRGQPEEEGSAAAAGSRRGESRPLPAPSSRGEATPDAAEETLHAQDATLVPEDVTIPRVGEDAPTLPGEEVPTLPGAIAPMHTGADAPMQTGADAPRPTGADTLAAPAEGTLGRARGARPSAGGSAPPPAGEGAAPARAPVVYAGRFEIVRVLGEGGMGKVFRVRDRQIEGREIALKVLRPRYSRNEEFRRLFFQEIRAAQGFVSEHVVQLRDTGRMDDGQLYLTMDLVEGEDLRALLAREGSLRPRHALEVARQMLLGLQAGHEQGFVHRDVKPSNVLLAARVPKSEDNPFGVGARLVDFGIAGLASEVEEGVVVGTPMYMSPEQTRGDRLDPRSDLFSVGVVLFEMVSGSRPFEGTTLKEIATSVIETDVGPMITEIDGLSKPMRRLLRRALQKDREKRFASAREFIAAIEGSKAFREPRAVPAWAGGALGLALVASGVQAVLLKGWSGRIGQLEDERQQALERHVADLQQAAAAARAERDGYWKPQHTELSEDLRSANERIAALEEDLRTGGDAGSTREAAFMDLEARVAGLEKENARLLEEQDQRARDLELARAQLAEFQTGQSPRALTAMAFDRVLSILAGATRVSAQDPLDAAIQRGAFDVEHEAGRDLVRALAHAHDALARASFALDEGRPGALHLEQAEEAHAEGLEQARAFTAQPPDWSFHAALGAEAPDRVAQLEDVLARLGERIDGMRAALSEQGRSAWGTIVEAGWDQGPEPVILHASHYGEARLADYLEGLAQHLEAQLVTPEGFLERDALERAPALAEWGAALAEVGKGPHTPAADSVRLFALARSWYGGVERRLLPPLAPALPEVEPGTPHGSWRAQLALQMRLGDPASSAYPARAGRVAVYRVTLEDGRVQWYVDSAGDGEERADRWQLSRRIYDAGGELVTTVPSFLLRRSGESFLDPVGQPVLNLRELGPNVRVVAWTEPFVEALPDRHWARGHDLAAFAAGVRRRPATCLAVQRGDAEHWISPRYGLVRERRDDGILLELAFATLLP